MRADATFWHADEETCIQYAIKAFHEEGSHAITIRHYYYKLLSSQGLRVSDSPNSKKNAYAWVSKIISDAREEGTFPWHAVVDNGRRSLSYFSSDSLSSYLWGESHSFYKIDPWRGQSLGRVEIIVEKDGLVDMVNRIVQKWRIPVRAADGFSSTTRNKELARHYGTGKGYTILYLGDFDPSGLLIQQKLKEKLNQYGSYPGVKRIALNQSDTLTLPEYAAIEVDPKNDHAKAVQWFRRYPNQRGYEIEALTTTQLERKILQAISPYIDENAFQEATELETSVRKQVSKLLKRALSTYEKETLTCGIEGISLALNEQWRYFLSPDEYTVASETGQLERIWEEEEDDIA